MAPRHDRMFIVKTDAANTEGLGGVFALLKGIGKPLPVPEAQRLYTPSLRFEAFERVAKVGESLGFGPNAQQPAAKPAML